MIGLSFIYQEALWLLLLLPALWALTLAVPARFRRWRTGASLVVRSVILVALIFSVAGAQLVRPVGEVTTVFLLDTSDSVSLSQRARAERFVREALAAMPADDRAAVVAFGGEAAIARPPSGERELVMPALPPAGDATNIAEALQLGLTLLPNEGHQRIVLLSDGGQTLGDARSAGQLAASRGVPVDVVPLSGAADGLDALVSSVELPATAREGQRLPMRVTLESSAAATGRLTVVGPGGELLVEQTVELAPGAQTVEISLPEAPAAFNRYVVRLDVPGDGRFQNNVAETYSFVSGRPRVLLVEGFTGEAAALERALKAAQIEAAVVPPPRVPATLGELSAYDAVVLVNVPRRALPETTLTMLKSYVHDLGHGLMMVGGPESFGAGGWKTSPVEDALPVTMDIPERLRMPPTSVVVVIDISGSMAEQENGRTKLSLAVEGAQRIASLIRDEDELTVIPFDNRARFVVGPIPGSRSEEAIDALSRVDLGGGGINIHDALVTAAGYVRQSDREIRHIITITDGDDTTQQDGALDIIESLRDEQVTLSSIAIGGGDHIDFIRSMPRAGGGRYFFTDRASTLPSILVDEARTVIQSYVVEAPFMPDLGVPHPALRNVSAAPRLGGFVMTTPRETSSVLLVTPEGDPVLAAWQHGLGRAMAWTSDFTGRWGTPWIEWAEFPRLSAQLITWLLPTEVAEGLTVQAAVTGGDLVLSAQARSPTGESLSGLRVSASLVTGDGASAPVELREVTPGEYRVTVRDRPAGAYLVQVVAEDASGLPVSSVTAGAVVPMSAEYRAQTADVALLQQLADETGGRAEPQPSQAFDRNSGSRGAVAEVGLPLLWLALALLPLDIALRRLMLGRDQVTGGMRRLGMPGLAARLNRPALSAANAHPPPPPPTAPRASEPPGEKRGAVLGKPDSSRAAELERLREAQEQARRRLRGEE